LKCEKKTKLITHYIFAIGLVAFIFPTYLPSALVLGFLVSFLMDHAGHERKGLTIRRTWVTHSVFTGSALGTVLGILLAFGFEYVNLPFSFVIFALQGFVSALSHLFLDAITEGGIFVFKKRFALAHFRYDDLFVNTGFALLGIFLFVLSLHPQLTFFPS